MLDLLLDLQSTIISMSSHETMVVKSRNFKATVNYKPVTVVEWLQWLACPLPTRRRWLRLGSNPGSSVCGVPDHA